MNGATSSLIDNHLQRIKALTKNVIRNFDENDQSKFPSHQNRKLIIVDNLSSEPTNRQSTTTKATTTSPTCLAHNRLGGGGEGKKANHESNANPIIAIENLVKSQVATTVFSELVEKAPPTSFLPPEGVQCVPM